MKEKKWKHLGVRISEDLHKDLFRSLKKYSDKQGRTVSASEIIVPAIQSFITGEK